MDGMANMAGNVKKWLKTTGNGWDGRKMLDIAENSRKGSGID